MPPTPDLPASPAARDAAKRRELRRAKRVAGALLCGMLVLLFASAAGRAAHPWLAWVQAFAEAAAVGAIADWYAVSALFRHPFGLPVPHTAIIPRRKDRLGASLGEFVEQHLLTPEHVLARLGQGSLARAGAEWLADPAQQRRIARRLGARAPLLFERLSDAEVRPAVERLLRQQFERIDLAQLAGEGLDLLTARGRHQLLLDRLLLALDEWLQSNRGLVRAKVSEGSKYTPAMFDAYIAGRFVDGVLALLHEVAAQPQHELRTRLDAAVQAYVHDLKTRPSFRRRGEAIRRALLEQLQPGQQAHALVEELRSHLVADLGSRHSRVRAVLVQLLDAAAQAIREDAALQRKLDAWAHQALGRLMRRHRHQVSLLIAEVVRRWDADEVCERVETEIGRDLQSIRLSGTLVGGTVGVLLHACTRLLA